MNSHTHNVSVRETQISDPLCTCQPATFSYKALCKTCSFASTPEIGKGPADAKEAYMKVLAKARRHADARNVHEGA